MIKSMRHKGLIELIDFGETAKIDQRMQARLLRRLDAIMQAQQPGDLNVPGFDFHPLKGFTPTRYSVHVNGPWCVTFEFDGIDAVNVDFEQYH